MCALWTKQGVNEHGIVWPWENDAVQTIGMIQKVFFKTVKIKEHNGKIP